MPIYLWLLGCDCRTLGIVPYDGFIVQLVEQTLGPLLGVVGMIVVQGYGV